MLLPLLLLLYRLLLCRVLEARVSVREKTCDIGLQKLAMVGVVTTLRGTTSKDESGRGTRLID